MRVILLLTILAFGCDKSENKIEIVKEFIEKVVLNKYYDVNNIDEFLDLKKSSLTPNSDLLKNINFNLDYLRSEIKSYEGYEIMTYEDFKKREQFKLYKINYSKSENIFCVVVGDKFITSIIVNNKQKISSFYTGLIKHKDNINPYILNK